MHIYATFEHSLNVEMAIGALEATGIPRRGIFAVPLTNRMKELRLFDTIHSADGISLFGTGAALGTALAVIGASVGFRSIGVRSFGD